MDEKLVIKTKQKEVLKNESMHKEGGFSFALIPTISIPLLDLMSSKTPIHRQNSILPQNPPFPFR